MPRSNAKELSFLCGSGFIKGLQLQKLGYEILGIWGMGIQGSAFKLTIRRRLHKLSSFVTRCRRNTLMRSRYTSNCTCCTLFGVLFQGPFREHLGCPKTAAPTEFPKCSHSECSTEFAAYPRIVAHCPRSFVHCHELLHVAKAEGYRYTPRTMSKPWQ